MLHIVIVLAWLIALGLAVYLANRAIKHRLWGRQERRRVLKKAGNLGDTTILMINGNTGCEMLIRCP
jgi:hypothetical protein